MATPADTARNTAGPTRSSLVALTETLQTTSAPSRRLRRRTLVNDCGRRYSRDVLLREALLARWPLEDTLAGERSPPKIHDPVRQVVCGAPPGRTLVSPGVPQGSREALRLRLFDQLLRVIARLLIQPPVHLPFTSC